MNFNFAIYFSVFIFSIIVLFDVLIKFKKPQSLKICFLGLAFCIGLVSLFHSLEIRTILSVSIILFCKAICVVCILAIFRILYFTHLKTKIHLLSLFIVFFTLLTLSYSYFIGRPNIDNFKYQTMVFGVENVFNTPLLFRIIRIMVLLSYVSFISYFWFIVSKKLEYNNLYFKGIKNWTIHILIISVLILLVNISVTFISFNLFSNQLISFLIYIYVLLVVFYRPQHLNKTIIDLGYGESFNIKSNLDINNQDFDLQFHTNFFFLNPEANLENFSQILNVSSTQVYNYIYGKYNMTFNDLINKNRVDYFLTIIREPKFKNYTIDALAKECGFSSRFHFYKPFKKFHGGTPSDLINSIKN